MLPDKLDKATSGHHAQTNLIHRSKAELGVQLSAPLAETAGTVPIHAPGSAQFMIKSETVSSFTRGAYSSEVPFGDRNSSSQPGEPTAVTALPGPSVAASMKPVSSGNASAAGDFAHAQHFAPISAWRVPVSAELPTQPQIVHRTGGLPVSRCMSPERLPQSSIGASNPVRFPHQALAPHASSTMPPSLLLVRQPLLPASTVLEPRLQLSPSVGTSPAGPTTGVSNSSPTRDLPSVSAAGTASKGPELNQLANRVYELLVKRLASERQRRGF